MWSIPAQHALFLPIFSRLLSALLDFVLNYQSTLSIAESGFKEFDLGRKGQFIKISCYGKWS